MKRIWIAMMMTALFVLHAPSACADMIAGLEDCAVADDALVSTFAQPQNAVRLTLDGVLLPYDSASNTYFIPQSADSSAFDGEIRLEREAGFSYYVHAPENFSKQHALSTSAGLTVYGVSGGACVSSDVVFTSLPVLCINTQSGGLPGDADEAGQLSMFSVHGRQIICDEAMIEINLRGNTSRSLPKKSYRVKIVDEDGEKQNLSIAGLRSDDDWILNPMYADTSKIREKLAYDLWEQINSVGQAAQSSRFAYAEVILNGEYWGLYGVQERIDRKQVDANRHVGVLYKVFANDRPGVQALLESEDPVFCGGFEVKFAGDYVDDVWEPAAAYMAFLNGTDDAQGASLSMRNVIDYGLWAMVAQAHDCHFKNQFIHCAYERENYVMYKIPWDLNHTFGDVWSAEDEEENYTRYYVGKLAMDGAFEKLIQIGGEEVYAAIRERWAKLRRDVVTEEAIAQRAREVHEPIYAAIVRDGRRWPECGMGDGNADNIRDIVISVKRNLPQIDAFIEALGTQQSE